MHFAIGLTRPVLITEGGTVSYLATVAFPVVVPVGWRSGSRGGWLAAGVEARLQISTV